MATSKRLDKQKPADPTALLLFASQELKRRLSVWHIDGDLGPVQKLSPSERLEFEGYRFRRIIDKETERPPNVFGYRILELEGRELEELRRRMNNPDLAGIVSDVLTNEYDRSTTQRWMGYFWWLLDQVPGGPQKDYVTAVWDQILDSRIWAGRKADKALYRPERPYQLTGHPVPEDHLTNLVAGVERLHQASHTPPKREKPKGSRQGVRLAQIAKLKRAMAAHARAARSFAYDRLQRGLEPEVLKRPTQEAFGEMVGIKSKVTVSRCFSHPEGADMKQLFELLNNLDWIMGHEASTPDDNEQA